MKAVTVAMRRQLPFVRVLADSYGRHHPDSAFAALMIDATPDELADERFEVMGLDDLSIDPDDLARMIFMYEPGELCGALKPWALEKALIEHELAVYLAPQADIYGSLESEIARAAHCDIVLTPQRRTTVPDDGLRPSTADIVDEGLFNLGFCAVGRRSSGVLDWWKTRLLTDAIRDRSIDLFGDQRWMDWAPVLFDCHRIEHVGMNVGYWNVDERELHFEDGQARCGDEPLKMFQFPGFDPRRPWQLSENVADSPRVVPSEFPQLRPLISQYRDALDANDEGGTGDEHYRYGFLPGGVPLPTSVRREYRRALLKSRRDGTEPPPVPDATDSFANLQAWFIAPSPDNPRMSRYASILWHSRRDLQIAFTFPEDEHFHGWQQWLRNHAVAEKQVPPGWAPEVDEQVQRMPDLAQTFGVNVFGYFTSELGLGETGRLLVRAVEASDVPFTSHVSTRNLSRQNLAFDERHSGTRYPINLVAMAPGPFVHWVQQWGTRYKPDSHTIGVWAWELERFPPELAAAQRYVDEVWAVSSFVRDAIQAAVDVPVHVFPHPVSVRQEQPRPAFLPFDATTPYFAFTFDYLSDVHRKNPHGLIRAFSRAFPDQDGPRLVLKSMNASKARAAKEIVLDAAEGREDVILVDEYLSVEDLDGFVQNALAYVSLHRSEGLGLGMLEAMAQGVPTIATAYSGNLDFMTDDTSILIPYTLVPTDSHSGPYAGIGQWADPDLDAAARAMRSLADEPQMAAELGKRGAADVLARCSLESSAGFVGSRLWEIFSERLAVGVPHRMRRRIGPDEADISGAEQ